MRKDIVIDNNAAKNFANPLDPEYKKLIRWLLYYDTNNKKKNAYLTVSQKLLTEYISTSGHSLSESNIVFIIGKLIREGRLPKVSNQQIKSFKLRYFTKRVVRSLTCNMKDRDHLPVVLLSYRKLALSLDRHFVNDINSFPGFNARAARRPQYLPYDQ